MAKNFFYDPVDDSPLKCEYCGGEFVPVRDLQKYCSPECIKEAGKIYGLSQKNKKKHKSTKNEPVFDPKGRLKNEKPL
jgi:hypothetical protein